VNTGPYFHAAEDDRCASYYLQHIQHLLPLLPQQQPRRTDSGFAVVAKDLLTAGWLGMVIVMLVEDRLACHRSAWEVRVTDPC
jgi:hypothetical protein